MESSVFSLANFQVFLLIIFRVHNLKSNVTCFSLCDSGMGAEKKKKKSVQPLLTSQSLQDILLTNESLSPRFHKKQWHPHISANTFLKIRMGKENVHLLSISINLKNSLIFFQCVKWQNITKKLPWQETLLTGTERLHYTLGFLMGKFNVSGAWECRKIIINMVCLVPASLDFDSFSQLGNQTLVDTLQNCS